MLTTGGQGHAEVQPAANLPPEKAAQDTYMRIK